MTSFRVGFSFLLLSELSLIQSFSTIIEGDESAADLSNNKQSLYDDGGKKRR